MDNLDKNKLILPLSSIKLPGVHDRGISLFFWDDDEILIDFAQLVVTAQLNIQSQQQQNLV